MEHGDEIQELLDSSPDRPFTVKEVGRAVDKKRSKEEPHWAKAVLENLCNERRIMQDAQGYYHGIR
jgi:hypothetical protein